MRKLTQSLSDGTTSLIDCPTPATTSGNVLIHSTTSLVSVGTERMLVDFGKANLIDKARQQPEKVQMVLDKVKTDGLATTYEAVRAKLDEPIPLGYCNVGVVAEVGGSVQGFSVGDRVISNGSHSEIVRVPKNLCAKIPDGVDDETASFTVLASIGLQGIRLANPTIGESVVVIGVGLIGLLTVQLLVAQGCRVLAVDFDSNKLNLAAKFGAETCNPAEGEDPIAAGMAFSRGLGVDAVLIIASAKSSDPVTQAARMSRKRGRIVLVGVTGLELNRSDFYEKELTFQVSCSYGPGRYDPGYEEGGNDYPIGFVRWTEQRNFEAILDLMASGKLDVSELVSHRYSFEEAPAAYETLSSDKSALGILLTYGTKAPIVSESTIKLSNKNVRYPAGSAVVGLVGAGNYASRVLMPAFKSGGAKLRTVVTSEGTSGVIHGEKSGFEQASTDLAGMLADDKINSVVIATQHNTHASFVCQALSAGKHVFVEKPLALTLEELESVISSWESNKHQLMVGFNRRFSPFTVKMKAMLDGMAEPKSLILTMNAGEIPADHWTQNPEVGGGRIIGEACHYIDLARFLIGAPVVSINATSVGGHGVTEDKASITLNFEDGSIAIVHYFANGHSGFAKERVEAFVGGRVIQLDNFRQMNAWGWPKYKKIRTLAQEKGQKECAKAFVEAVKEGGAPLIPPEELFEVAKVTIEAATQIREARS